MIRVEEKRNVHLYHDENPSTHPFMYGAIAFSELWPPSESASVLLCPQLVSCNLDSQIVFSLSILSNGSLIFPRHELFAGARLSVLRPSPNLEDHGISFRKGQHL